jgi:hypothetical protein
MVNLIQNLAFKIFVLAPNPTTFICSNGLCFEKVLMNAALILEKEKYAKEFKKKRSANTQANASSRFFWPSLKL